jgi:hypothetical protein
MRVENNMTVSFSIFLLLFEETKVGADCPLIKYEKYAFYYVVLRIDIRAGDVKFIFRLTAGSSSSRRSPLGGCMDYCRRRGPC